MESISPRRCSVVGAYRRTSGPSMVRLQELGVADEIALRYGPLEESNSRGALEKLKPDEIYNLAARSFVGLSFDLPLYTADIDALAVLRLLEVMREVCPDAPFYQASTSEMFGKAQETPQSEKTPFYPRGPLAWPSSSPIGAW
jgi:GDPmannose 4,6-dehydratase